MRISKQFRIEAAHQLPDSECYGQCSNLHGHSYLLTVKVCGPMSAEGWVMNFSTLSDFINTEIVAKCDHRFLKFNGKILIPVKYYLDRQPGDLPTTAENLGLFWADMIRRWLRGAHPDITLASLEVRETEKCTAYITDEDFPSEE